MPEDSEPKTLAMLKMEKNFVGVVEKGYPRKPYLMFPVWKYGYTSQTLFEFFVQESNELHSAVVKACMTRDPKDIEEARKEVADVSNCLDFLDEGLLRMEVSK